jgi:FkbM family methyltransferase
MSNFSFYNLARYSSLSESLFEILTRKKAISQKFYSGFLQRGPMPEEGKKVAFDIGANKGNKVSALLGLGYEVIALEPEKNSLSTLRWRFSRNRKVTILDKGVSEAPGKTSIYIAGPRSGLNTLSTKWKDVLQKSDTNRWGKTFTYSDSYEISLTTLDELIRQYGLPHFIKIDVEGYENKVLKGLSHRVAFVSFETNLPEFLDETIECIAMLKNLSPEAVFNYSLSDKMELDKWITGGELTNLIKSPSFRYMEIVCSSNPADPAHNTL